MLTTRDVVESQPSIDQQIRFMCSTIRGAAERLQDHRCMTEDELSLFFSCASSLTSALNQFHQGQSIVQSSPHQQSKIDVASTDQKEKNTRSPLKNNNSVASSSPQFKLRKICTQCNTLETPTWRKVTRCIFSTPSLCNSLLTHLTFKKKGPHGRGTVSFSKRWIHLCVLSPFFVCGNVGWESNPCTDHGLSFNLNCHSCATAADWDGISNRRRWQRESCNLQRSRTARWKVAVVVVVRAG